MLVVAACSLLRTKPLRQTAYGPGSRSNEDRSVHLRRFPGRSDRAVRYLAWLCLFLTVWPGFSIAADAPPPATVPVVTNVSGAVVVRSAGGVSRDVVSSRIVHAGDTLITGVDSLAVLSLADVGTIRLGPGSTARALATASSLSLGLDAGSMCAQAQTSAITVHAGNLAIAAADDTAIFSLIRDSNETTIAVYQGQISTTLSKKSPTILRAGEAAVSSHDGNPVQVPIQSVQAQFSALKCPDDVIIARVVPTPEPSSASSGHGGGGGGGFLGILLGIGALAALAGHGGGGGGGGSQPTPPPGPGQLSVNPTSLSFLVGGASQQFTASETNYSGVINASSGNAAVATVAPASGSNPATFTVTPTGAGSTSITVTDNHGGSQVVSVTVNQLSVNPTSLSFLVGGNPQPFTASENSYSGPINASSGNAAVATVAPASGSNPATFTVTPTGPGSTSITVTDNHGGSAVVSVTVTPPGALSVNPTSLSFLVGGAPQTFSASESSYTGAITAASGNNSVATVSPASGTSPVTFTVTPTGPGSTTISVQDNHGGSKTVSITVTPPGSLSVTPGSLTFTTPAAGGTPQPFTASQSSYTGPITAVSNDVTIATVSGSGNGPGPVTFTVTPVGPGATTMTVTGGGGHTATVNVTVVGPLKVNPTSLTFSGTTASQSFTATDPLYTGALTASVDKPGIATVSPLTQTGPGPVTFNVTPHSEGSATVTVSDTFGETAQVSIVVSAGGLSVNPTDLTFTVTGSGQTFSAVENDYTGPITATSNHPGIASVSPPSGNGPTPPPFTVTPVSAGNAAIAVSDAHANTKFVDITVTGPLTPTPTSLTFNGNAAPQTINVTDPNYFSSINASSTNLGVATVTSPGTGPNASFTVTPVNQTAAGGIATINFIDLNGGATSASVAVNPGPLGVSKSTISLTGFGATDSFTASETLYSGPINAASTNTAVATVSPASGSGPGPVTFTLTAAGPGTATINTSDNHSGAQSVSVTVTETPTVGALTPFTDVGAGSTQSPTVTEGGYTGTFSVVSNTCASIASVGPVPGTGPSTTVPVTPLTTTASGGACQFQVKDDVNGGVSATVSVTVGPFGAVAPTPNTLSFSDIGAGAAKTFTVSESNYSGNFTLDISSCPSSVATVSPASGTASTTFTVTPVGSGSCTIKVNDDHTQTATVSATVASFGSIVPAPTSLTFTDIVPTQTFGVTESGYTGKFTIDQSSCASIASVSPLSGDSTTTFTVTPSSSSASGGTCNLSITDDHSSPAATVSVTFGPFGALTPSPASLAFMVSGASQNFAVNETNYTGSFTIDASKCSGPGIATESPSSGTKTTTFTVTPGSVVGNCAIKIGDDHGGQNSLVVSVTKGTLTVTPISLSFAGPGAASQTFTANDTGAAVFSASSSDTTIATVLPPTQPGPGPVTFTVTPSATNTGTATITVTDDILGQAVVSVGVGVSPLIKKRHATLPPQPLHAPLPKSTPTPHVRPPVRGPIGPIGPRRITVDGGGEPPELVSPTPTPMPAQSPAPRPTTPPIAPVLTASVVNVVLTAGAAAQTLVVSEPGYPRLFTVSTSNAAVAAPNSTNGSGPTFTITIIPRSAGIALIRVADDHGGVRVITVIVRAAAPPAPHPGRPGSR